MYSQCSVSCCVCLLCQYRFTLVCIGIYWCIYWCMLVYIVVFYRVVCCVCIASGVDIANIGISSLQNQMRKWGKRWKRENIWKKKISAFCVIASQYFCILCDCISVFWRWMYFVWLWGEDGGATQPNKWWQLRPKGIYRMCTALDKIWTNKQTNKYYNTPNINNKQILNTIQNMNKETKK